MGHLCSELCKAKMKSFDKPPHHLEPRLRDAPDDDGLILTILYTNTDDHTQLGCGMRFLFCPACGEKLT